MNKTLINTKNLLKIIISILVIFSMLKSCSMAYNIDDIYEYSIQINQNANILKNCTNQIIRNYDKLKAISQLQNCKSILVQRSYYNDETDLLYWNQPYKISFDNSQNIIGLPAAQFVRINSSDNVSIGTFTIDVRSDPGWGFGLLDLSLNTEQEITNFNWSNWYLNNKYEEPSTFEYTPYNITTTDDYNILKFSYVGNVALGLLGDNDYYQLEVRLKDGNLTTLGTALFNENQECYYRDNALIVENNQTILANTVYLNYYNGYYLEFTIYSDRNNYEMQGHLYKFYPQNAVIENGQIVSPGSGDYTNQNQTIDLIGGIVGDMPSGDSPGSGILGGLSSLFIPSSDFFFRYFNNLNTWLTEHLGFLYSPFSIFFDLINRVIVVDFSDPMVEIGPYNLPLNDDIEFIHRYEYHFNDLLLDENAVTIHDIYLIIVDGILILGFLHMLYCKYEEIIGGKKEQ